MNRSVILLSLVTTLCALPAWSIEIDGGAVVGGALGGGAGAAVGSAIGGKNGAIVGAAVGGAAGAAIGSAEPSPKRVKSSYRVKHDDDHHDHGKHRGHYKKKHKHDHDD